MSLLANSNAIESGGYNIDRSLRFRSSASAYLNRTLTTPTDNKKWTFSAWVKIGKISTVINLLSAGTGSSNDASLMFDSTGSVWLYYWTGSYVFSLYTNAYFRDPSAWYHVVVVYDSTQAQTAQSLPDSRVRFYINGTQYSSTGTLPSQNYASNQINAAVAHRIGYTIASVYPFDGYLAEVNFIDGQALTPSSFGQTDPVTGVWTPKKYTGTYGTNGFYLPFSDNTSATTLAYDKSGNGNNWTPNNISTTAGATYDSMTDVPTLTSATAANYCVLNPLHMRGACTVSNGNLNGNIPSGTAANGTLTSTIAISSGKYYWEVTGLSSNYYADIGLVADTISAASMNTRSSGGVAYSYFNGSKYVNGTNSSYGASFTYTDTIGVAIDADGGTVTFYKNNTSQGAITLPSGYSSWFPAVTTDTGSASMGVVFNFGQRPFSYTPPTGFKALNTFNLPDPTIKKPNQYMDATTYTGTGATQTITVNFAPNFAWLKRRDGVGENTLLDTSRLTGSLPNRLYSNSTSAESTIADGQNSFSSTGIVLDGTGSGGEINYNGRTYVGWQWKKGATPGFDIVTYTGNYNGSTGTQTIAHNLGVAPKMIIIKNRSAAYDWAVGHASIGWNQAGNLNLTNSFGTSSYFNSTAPTASVFSVGMSNISNQNLSTHVAYLFAEIAGFSKFGSYTGNGSTDGPFVYCGFRPSWILLKRTDTTGNWILLDNRRYEYNSTVSPRELYANLSNAEADSNGADILSNGFKLKVIYNSYNVNGGTYVYACFAENPFRYSLAR